MPYIDHIVADILYTQIDSESEKSDHSIARCACTLLTTQNNGTVAVKTTGPCDVIVHRTGEDERHFLIIFQNICLHLSRFLRKQQHIVKVPLLPRQFLLRSMLPKDALQEPKRTVQTNLINLNRKPRQYCVRARRMAVQTSLPSFPV